MQRRLTATRRTQRYRLAGEFPSALELAGEQAKVPVHSPSSRRLYRGRPRGAYRQAAMTTIPTGRGHEVRLVAPTACPDGHPLAPPNVQLLYDVAPSGQRMTGGRCWTFRTIT